MDVTWVSFCAWDKKEPQTAAAPAFPGDFGRAGKIADLCGTWAVPGVLSATAFTP